MQTYVGNPSSPISGRSIPPASIGWTVAFSVVLILLGLVALTIPFLAGVAAEAIIAWLLIFGGIAHLIFAFHVRGAGTHLWEALIGITYLVAGGFLFLHPVAGLISLTAFLGAYLLLKGVLEIVAGLTVRGLTGGIWLFVDAVISIVLAIVIWTHLFSAATWAVGTLLGVAVLFSGISRLALSLAAKRSHAALI